MKLVAEAFAKVNRSLVVLGKRPDGYHELDTLFQAVGLTDRLTFEESDGLTLDVDDPSIPAGAENLVLRAARALAEAAGIRPRAAITLEKRIPSGGGLGGGSADAAVTLLGLSALWKLDLPLDLLARVGGALGSDVPFFLHGGTARGLGRGERIEPLPDLPPQAVVLVMPPFPVSTPAVFRRLEAPAWDGRGGWALGAGDAPDRNDLEPAAEALFPALRDVREALERAGAARARLSGSGSTVFGLFPDLAAATEGARRLEGLPAGSAVRIVPTLSREESRSRSAPRRAG
ncbi:MAG: 4-(cytidine 5'-diphospho)-2-C-methyl-D-erythritol kinase [Holophagales bacterium]|nr:4-(cytidine 5'-diphospho)-2-C-methyl-D-erythritol kinase [Holophagales bacterium]